MSFPTGSQVSTQHLDSSSDDPSQARAGLLQAVQNLNTIVAGAGSASGVALLDANGRIPGTQVPANIETATNINLVPATRIVKIDAVLRLQPVSVDELLAIQNVTAGDCAFVENGDSGAPCLAVFAQSQWNVIPFITGTISKTTVVAVAGRFTLLCDGTKL
jgi:hypothetical protein